MKNFPMPENPDVARHRQAQAMRERTVDQLAVLNEATERIAQGGEKLERLTGRLVWLTAVLIVLSIALLVAALVPLVRGH